MSDELDLDEIEAHWEYARDFPDSGSGDVFALIAELRRANAVLGIESETTDKLRAAAMESNDSVCRAMEELRDAIKESNEAVCRAIEERLDAFRNLPGRRLDG